MGVKMVAPGVVVTPSAVTAAVARVNPLVTYTAFGSTSYASVSLGNQIVINKPSGVTQGKIMLAHIVLDALLTVVPPSGWEAVSAKDNGTLRSTVYRKIAGASEPSSYTWTFV